MANYEELLTEAEATLASPDRLGGLPVGVSSILYVRDWEGRNKIKLPAKLARSRRVSDLILISLCLYPSIREAEDPTQIWLGDMKRTISRSNDRAVTQSLVIREIGILIDERWVSANPPTTRPASAIIADATALSLHPRLEVSEAELMALRPLYIPAQEEVSQAS